MKPLLDSTILFHLFIIYPNIYKLFRIPVEPGKKVTQQSFHKLLGHLIITVVITRKMTSYRPTSSLVLTSEQS